MVRLVLTLTLAFASVTQAQDPLIGAYEQLAREMEQRDWQGALVASRRVLDQQSEPSALRESVECMHVLLLELQLREHLASSPDGVDALSLELRGLADVLRELADAYPTCARDAPPGVAADPSRSTELSYLQPRVERAASLAAGARDAENPSVELEQVFASEHAELVAQIEPGPRDAWQRVEHLWQAQHPPEPRSHEWPARSEAPTIATGVLVLGFGLVSFFSTLTALSGSGVPSLSAGGWGITFSLLPAIAAAWTWQRPKRGLLLASLALTSVAAAGGAIAIGRLGRDGRYFGRGLLIGSAVSVMWQIGGWMHYRYPDRSAREWKRRVRVSPTAGRGFGGVSASGSF